jgi:hypothetical protein
MTSMYQALFIPHRLLSHLHSSHALGYITVSLKATLITCAVVVVARPPFNCRARLEMACNIRDLCRGHCHYCCLPNPNLMCGPVSELSLFTVVAALKLRHSEKKHCDHDLWRPRRHLWLLKGPTSGLRAVPHAVSATLQ